MLKIKMNYEMEKHLLDLTGLPNLSYK